MTAAAAWRALSWLVACGVTYGAVRSFTESKQVDSRLFISICETTPAQRRDINSEHKSHTHTHACTQTHGDLLKWNTPCLTFTGVRPYSSDRERILKEWNHHQHGRRTIDLPLFNLARWLAEGKTGRWEGPKTLIVFLSPHRSARMTQRGETRREADKQRERHRLQVGEMKSVCRGSGLPPPPHNNAH